MLRMTAPAFLPISISSMTFSSSSILLSLLMKKNSSSYMYVSALCDGIGSYAAQAQSDGSRACG